MGEDKTQTLDMLKWVSFKVAVPTSLIGDPTQNVVRYCSLCEGCEDWDRDKQKCTSGDDYYKLSGGGMDAPV